MKHWCYVGLLVLLMACNSSLVNERFDVPDNVWLKEMPLVFQATITDNSSPVNIKLQLRHGSYITQKSINMKMTYTSPSGKTEDKYFTFDLRNADGSLKGEAAGDICDTEMTVITGVKLPEQGQYKVSVQHEMEDAALPLIMDMSLVIEKSK